MIEGQRIKNIKEDSQFFGEKAMVTKVTSQKTYVEYDNGEKGFSTKPDEHYQVLNEGRICKEWRERNQGTDTACDPCNSTYENSEKPYMEKAVSSAIKAVKRALMSKTDRDLIDAGLKDECGTYTATALELLAQANAQEDVDSGADSVLVSASSAILADRKAKKEANN